MTQVPSAPGPANQSARFAKTELWVQITTGGQPYPPSFQDMFLDPMFKPGTTIEVRVTKPGLIGKVLQYETQAASEPRMVAQCLPPGSSKAVAC